MSDDAIAATLAALNQRISALIVVLEEINHSLKGAGDETPSQEPK